MKNKNTKLIIILSTIIFILITLLIIVSVFGFKRILDFISNLDYAVVTAVISLVTALYTIIHDRKESKKSIDSAIKSQNQIEFENRLYDVLNIYDQLLYDISSLRMEYTNVTIDENYLIKSESIDNHVNCITKYYFLLNDVEYKIKYYYKLHNQIHNEYDIFITEIKGLNQLLLLELDHYVDLAPKMRKVNNDYFNYKYEHMQNPTNPFAFDFKDVNSIVDESNKIVKNIGDIISSKKQLLYDEALKCIMEREIVLKNNTLI